MDFPVVEQIGQAIVERIKGVKTYLGYQTDLKEVVRVTRLGTTYSPSHMQAVVLHGETERDPERDSVADVPLIHYRQTFVIRLHAMPEENNNVPVDQTTNQMAADVCKAICTSPAGQQWWNWGNPHLAVNTELGSPRRVDTSDGSTDGVEIPLIVDYRHPENDPYTAA